MRRFYAPALAGLILAGGSAAAAAPSQFDLNCTGWKLGSAPGQRLPYQVHYSIDLDAKTWCAKSCGTIAEVTPDEIVFSRSDAHSRGRQHTIDRRTGKLTDSYVDDVIRDERHATCEIAAFTPFPATKF